MKGLKVIFHKVTSFALSSSPPLPFQIWYLSCWLLWVFMRKWPSVSHLPIYCKAKHRALTWWLRARHLTSEMHIASKGHFTHSWNVNSKLPVGCDMRIHEQKGAGTFVHLHAAPAYCPAYPPPVQHKQPREERAALACVWVCVTGIFPNTPRPLVLPSVSLSQSFIDFP